MTGWRRLAAAPLLVLLLFLPARGAELWDQVDVDGLEDQVQEEMDLSLTPEIDLDQGLAQLGTSLIEQLGGVLTQATHSGGQILVITLLCALLQSVCPEKGEGIGAARLAAALVTTTVAMGDVNSLLDLGRETVIKLHDFTALLIPTMTTAAVASGSVTGAAARQMATLFCSNLLLGLIQNLMIPLVYLYIAACTGSVATGNRGIQSVAAFLKWGIKSLLTWTLLIFTAHLSLSGAISGTADRAAVKLTRFAISGMVPVVGGILSDATESVLAGAGILRNAIGVFGALGVLAFCLTPFLRLGIQYLLYKVAAVLSALVTESPVTQLIAAIGEAFGLVLGMVGASALVTLLSVVTAVLVVVD